MSTNIVAAAKSFVEDAENDEITLVMALEFLGLLASTLGFAEFLPLLMIILGATAATAGIVYELWEAFKCFKG